MKGEEVNVPDLAASFQERIAGILAENCCWLPPTPVQSRCVWRAVWPQTAVCASW